MITNVLFISYTFTNVFDRIKGREAQNKYKSGKQKSYIHTCEPRDENSQLPNCNKWFTFRN